ncbi:MAG TPA: serine hydrolase [Candidatus Ozemobacteraceae bacterium]
MKCLCRLLLLVAIILWLPLPGSSAEAPGTLESAVLKAFFAGDVKDHTAVFAENLLKLAPAAKLDEIRDLYRGKLGDLREAAVRDGACDLLFTRGKAPCNIHIDANRKVDMIWFGAWSLFNDDTTTLAAEFAKLPGIVSVTVRRDDADRLFAIESDRPLAVGSSFKLYVLKALEQASAAGRLSPKTVVCLNPDLKTLPTGICQEWPASTPVTLATLANLMISMSDNTATDHLITILGREAVEAAAPRRMRPFLTTMEMFRLKFSPDKARAETFAKAGPDRRRELLATLGTASVSVSDIPQTPAFIDSIEWFATTDELCRVIHELRDHPATAINPGLVDKTRWHRVAYKGGSEPGVLNYTLALQKASASPTYTLSATINDSAREVDTKGFTELVLRLINLIEDGRLSVPEKR